MIPNIFEWQPSIITAAAGSGAGDAYATLADLRADPSMKLAAGETADDALLQDLLVGVSAFIDAYTGRTFAASADTTRYLDAGVWQAGYLYPEYDLAQITSIVNGDGEILAASDFVTEPREAGVPIWQIQLKGSTGKFFTYTDDPERAIAITGRWAYSVTAPETIRRATIIGAAALYRMSLSGDSDRPIIAGGGIVIEPSRLPSMFWALVKPYVRVI